ncbi:MAG TPA: septum formation inhibitor Maf [Leucothrix mucor]|nr:septum formation inhibitor Maf [Leucothrix mucor]
MQQQIILSSTSPFRKELLQRLSIPFITDSPDIDETALKDEAPEDYVRRLSLEKAQAVAKNHPNALIIGSDQCSVLKGEIRGKPGNHINAVKQLQQSSNERVSFLTGLCLLDSKTNNFQLDMIPFHVDFRVLTNNEIETYLKAEEPYACAGSFKSEGLGISLFNRLEGDDPTALIGLPLIRLSSMLRQHGISIPAK